MMYDAIIIGAGLGGLSSALSLAIANKKVLVLEQHNLPGGCSTSFVRGRFEFDASLHEFCALGEPNHRGFAGKILFDEYGVKIDTAVAKELFRAKFISRNGTDIDITLPWGEEAFAKALTAFDPTCQKAIELYLSLSKECLEVSTYFDANLYQKRKRNGDVKTDSLYFVTHHLRYLKIAELPYNEVCRKIGLSEDIIDILNCYQVYLGVQGEDISFAHLATMIYQYIVFGPGYVLPNSHALAVAMVKRLEELGGKVYYHVKVTGIKADENGNILGVITDHGEFETNHVIANMYPKSAYRLLPKSIAIPLRESKREQAFPVSSRFVDVYLGLNRSLEELGIEEYTLFFPGDLRAKKKTLGPLDYLQAAATHYNHINPNASPEGTSIITFTLEFTTDIWGEVDIASYTKTKEAIAKKAIAEYEELTGRSIMPYIEEIEIASPWTFARYLGTPEGGVYGLTKNMKSSILSEMMTIRRDQPIKGFKCTGAAGARGDGYCQTIATGKDIAMLTLEEMGGRK